MKAASRAEAYAETIQAGALQYQVGATELALTLAVSAGATNNSAVIATNGNFTKAAVSLKLDQTGNLTLQRYLDEAGLIAIGAPITVALVANTQNFVTVTDGVPFAAFKVSVQNTSGSPGTVSNVGVLLQSL